MFDVLLANPKNKLKGLKMGKTKDRLVAEKLWDMLDNIDTLSDMIKPNDSEGYIKYYESVNKIHTKRVELLNSDGYDLFTKEEWQNRPVNEENKTIPTK